MPNKKPLKYLVVSVNCNEFDILKVTHNILSTIIYLLYFASVLNQYA